MSAQSPAMWAILLWLAGAPVAAALMPRALERLSRDAKRDEAARTRAAHDAAHPWDAKQDMRAAGNAGNFHRTVDSLLDMARVDRRLTMGAYFILGLSWPAFVAWRLSVKAGKYVSVPSAQVVFVCDGCQAEAGWAWGGRLAKRRAVKAGYQFLGEDEGYCWTCQVTGRVPIAS